MLGMLQVYFVLLQPMRPIFVRLLSISRYQPEAEFQAAPAVVFLFMTER